MTLILLSADKAKLFGLVQQDQDEATALQQLAAQGFSERAAREHLQEALYACAFRRAENVIVTRQFRNDEGKFVPAALQDADGTTEPIVRGKRGVKTP